MPAKNLANGSVSRKSGKRIRKAISWMLFFSRHKTVFSRKDNRRFTFLLSFITLTLSSKQLHSDEYIKKFMLRPFLKWLERNGCAMYVWKAEAQANGNIHFHVTVNNFIHWMSIRKKWNKLQHAHGYHKVFTEGREDIGMNSTDVHSVRNAKQTAAYMAKYMTKNEAGRRLIAGKVWGCSASLCKISCILDEHSSSDMDELVNWLENNGQLLLSDEYMRVYTHEHLKFVKLPPVLAKMTRPILEHRSEMIACQKLLIEVESFG